MQLKTPIALTSKKTFELQIISPETSPVEKKFVTKTRNIWKNSCIKPFVKEYNFFPSLVTYDISKKIINIFIQSYPISILCNRNTELLCQILKICVKKGFYINEINFIYKCKNKLT